MLSFKSLVEISWRIACFASLLIQMVSCTVKTDNGCRDYAHIRPDIIEYRSSIIMRLDSLRSVGNLSIRFDQKPCAMDFLDSMAIYLDHKVIYFGPYSSRLYAKLPRIIPNKQVRLSIEFVGENDVYILSDKHVFPWSKSIVGIRVNELSDTVFHPIRDTRYDILQQKRLNVGSVSE